MHCSILKRLLWDTLLILCLFSSILAQDLFHMMAQRSLQQGHQDVQPMMQLSPFRRQEREHAHHHHHRDPSVGRQSSHERHHGPHRHPFQRQISGYTGNMDDMDFHRADDKAGNDSNIDMFLGMKIYAGPGLRYLADAVDNGAYGGAGGYGGGRSGNGWSSGGSGGGGSGGGSGGYRPYPSKCQRERDAALANQKNGMLGAFIPACKTNGDYDKKQTIGNTDYCSDSLGAFIVGTAVPSRTPLNCDDWVDNDGYPKNPPAISGTGGSGSGSGGSVIGGSGSGSITTPTTTPTTTTTTTTPTTTTTTTTTTTQYVPVTRATAAYTAAPYTGYTGATRGTAATVIRGRRRRQAKNLNLAH